MKYLKKLQLLEVINFLKELNAEKLEDITFIDNTESGKEIIEHIDEQVIKDFKLTGLTNFEFFKQEYYKMTGSLFTT